MHTFISKEDQVLDFLGEAGFVSTWLILQRLKEKEEG